MVYRVTTPVAFVATVMLAGAGLVCWSATADAACDWNLPGSLTLIQDNNLQVQIATNDNRLVGQARYAHVGGDDWTSGTPKGGLVDSHGRRVVFTVDWTDGPGKGLYNNYIGDIADNGAISGHTNNSLGTTNNWTSQQNAACVERQLPGTPITAADEPPSPVATAPKNAPPTNTATINGDVDVYDEPGGSGTIINTLRKGAQVTVQERRDDNWVHLAGAGWVWGDFVSH
jgi:hypothetical protein